MKKLAIFKTSLICVICLSLFGFGLIFSGCGGDDDDSAESNIDLSQYSGTWIGTFSGTDTGTWEVVIDSQGNATGTGFSNDLNQTYNIYGKANQNNVLEFEASFDGGGTIGSKFTGTFSDTNTCSGTWTNENYSSEHGTFEGSKVIDS